jgi:hypothetical protein
MYDDFKNGILRQWPTNDPARTIELKRKDYAAEIRIDDRLVERMNARDFLSYRDEALRQTILRLERSIYGIDHPKVHVVRYPADWWQSLKERFAPAWFRDRYPVRFTEVTASLEELYPEIEPALPDKGHVMKINVAKRTLVAFCRWDEKAY